MKTKNKLTNILSIATLGIAALTAGCNSGGSTSAQPQTQNSAGTMNDSINISGSDTAGLLGFEINVPDVFEQLAGEISPYVWNVLTTGQWSTPAEQNKEFVKSALLGIESGVDQILQNQETELNTLQQIYNLQIVNNLTSQQQSLQQYLNYYTIANQQFGQWINQGAGASAESSFNGSSMAAFTTAQINALLGAHNIAALKNTYATIATQLDAYEADTSCDSANSYVNGGHSQPNNACTSANLLQAYYTQFVQNLGSNSQVPINNGVVSLPGQPQQNSFVTLQQFLNTLDGTQAAIYSALTQAYEVDQVRIYFYYALEQRSPGLGQATLDLPAVVTGSNNESAAQQTLNTAFQTRISFVQQMINNYKLQAYNLAVGNIAPSDTNLPANCGLSLAQIGSNPIQFSNSIATSQESGTPYWDTNTLVLNCANPRHGPNATITTTTKVSQMCFPTNDNVASKNLSYYMSSQSGYITCGAGNYLANNLENTTLNMGAANVYSTTPNTASPNFYNYGGGIGGTANLDLYFLNNIPSASYPGNNYAYSTSDTSAGGLYATYYTSWNGSNNHWHIHVGTHYFSISALCYVASDGWEFADDGTHAFLVGGLTCSDSNPAGAVLQCIPGDQNCVQGVFQNPNASFGSNGQSDYFGLKFSNGDAISMWQLGGASGGSDTQGNYYINNYYNGTAAPDSYSAAKFTNVTHNNYTVDTNTD